MKLIEAVRKARETGYKYIAVDRNLAMYGYTEIPEVFFNIWEVGSHAASTFIGNYKLTCDWKESLIDVDNLQGVE